jgi:uncharacterized protein (DUF433 family)
LIAFLVDQNFNEHILDALTRRDSTVEFTHVRDIGLAAAPDPAVLEWAAAHGLVLLTHDRKTIPRFAYDRVAAGLPMQSGHERSGRRPIAMEHASADPQAGSHQHIAWQRVVSNPRRGYAEVMDYGQIITIEPGKRSGKPCIRGLRITVTDVLEYLAAGMNVDQILEDFPDLTVEDIRACLAFAADRERRLCVVPPG